MNREIEKLCGEINQLRISNAALCRAIGELSTRIELANGEQDGIKTLLKKQLLVQEKIFQTKGYKTLIPQQEFYQDMKNGLDELKNLMKDFKRG